MSRPRRRPGQTRTVGEEREERGSTLVQSVTSSLKWKKRFLDTTGEREMDGMSSVEYYLILCFSLQGWGIEKFQI